MRTSPRPRADTHSCPHTRHGGADDGAAGASVVCARGSVRRRCVALRLRGIAPRSHSIAPPCAWWRVINPPRICVNVLKWVMIWQALAHLPIHVCQLAKISQKYRKNPIRLPCPALPRTARTAARTADRQPEICKLRPWSADMPGRGRQVGSRPRLYSAGARATAQKRDTRPFLRFLRHEKLDRPCPGLCPGQYICGKCAKNYAKLIDTLECARTSRVIC